MAVGFLEEAALLPSSLTYDNSELVPRITQTLIRCENDDRSNLHTVHLPAGSISNLIRVAERNLERSIYESWLRHESIRRIERCTRAIVKLERRLADKSSLAFDDPISNFFPILRLRSLSSYPVVSARLISSNHLFNFS